MHKSLLTIVGASLVLVSLILAAPSLIQAQDGLGVQTLRQWSTRSGSSKTNAALVGFKDGMVQLRKDDGTVVSIAIEKLSNTDQEYVRKQDAGSRKADDSAATKAGVGASSELESRCRDLCDQITKGYARNSAGGKPTIAVVEFSDLSGGVTDLGRLLSEELITKLFSTGNYKVIERLLLNKAIAEHKLQLQGLVDPKSAKELGKILGVDSIVSGTIADVGDSLRVNARLISTETGEILSVAAATIRKDDAAKKLLAAAGEKSAEFDSAPPVATSHGNIQLPFRDDFSECKEGELTDWGRAGKVATGPDGRKWLVPSGIGQKPIGRDMQLPDDVYVEFDYSAVKLTSDDRKVGSVLSAVSFIDEAGDKFRVELIVTLGERNGGPIETLELKLPGGASVSERGLSGGGRSEGVSIGTIRIHKAGYSITVARDGSHKELTANVSDFKSFKRIEVDMYKGPNSMIAFTNFKVGKSSPAAKK
jgi:TolB-like protein